MGKGNIQYILQIASGDMLKFMQKVNGNPNMSHKGI